MARNVVSIGGKPVGDGHPCYITAEVGINHNGSLDLALTLIDAVSAPIESFRVGGAVSKVPAADAVKFQKRDLLTVYTPSELAAPRESPYGTTNGDLKRRLEFGEPEYRAIDAQCKKKGIVWFASPWDLTSVEFLRRFNPPAVKVASASLTDDELLLACRSLGVPVILSTGMSTMEQIAHAVGVLGEEDLILLHCTSTYPCPTEELNLRVITTLRNEFPNLPIGWSGHSTGEEESLMAVTLGACMVEVHVTLDRTMYGSDQKASLEIPKFRLACRYIRDAAVALGDGVKIVYPSEVPIAKKLRRVDSQHLGAKVS